MNPTDATHGARHPSAWCIFLIFLRLGLTSFGGPSAHLGYFRNEFVIRRAWLSDRGYADLVGLCQFLPGPASSQVGMALGLMQGGYSGAFAAWAGFTLPSALALMLFAQGISSGVGLDAGALHGLKIVAVAVVAQAVWGMARNLCTTYTSIIIAGAAACSALIWPGVFGQILAIASAAFFGMVFFKPQHAHAREPLPIILSRKVGTALLTIFFILLAGLPVLAAAWHHQGIEMANVFYRAGALVFGGGHVMLPLLQTAVVPNGWVTIETFIAGYGATQAVPGPLFTFAAFLGASMGNAPNGIVGAMICLIAIFVPSFLLVAGALPFWEVLRNNLRAQAALIGINAAVVGLLLAALYDPVWRNAIFGFQDFMLAATALAALMFLKIPPWLIVMLCAASGWLLGMLQ